MDTQILKDKGILRLRDVISLIGLRKSCIYSKMRNGEFPKTVSLGGRTVGWRSSDVLEWIDSLRRKEVEK